MAEGYNLKSAATPSIVDSIASWVSNYRENSLEYAHDQSMMTLMTPDEALLIVGPPRLVSGDPPDNTDDNSNYHIVGFVGNLQYTETATVQPLKAIGSRRHIFAKTNAPVQGNIGRLMILGRNLIYTMYQGVDKSILKDNTKYGEGTVWYTNLEDDLFRIPFGMGVVYASPGTLNANTVYVSEYIEACVLTSRSSVIQTGQAMIMENVTFVADRVTPGFMDKSLTTDPTTNNPYGLLK